MLEPVRLALFTMIGLASLAISQPAQAGPPQLISRDVLFGNPDRAAVRLSPDGKQLSFLAPVDGVLNVWVGPAGDFSAAKPVTDDKHRGIRVYFWAYTNRHILYLQDKDGDENWRVYSKDLQTGTTKDLTPLTGVQARIQAVSEKFPTDVLIGLNSRDPQRHDIYRVNIETGEHALVLENDRFSGFATDDDYRIRLGTRVTEKGGFELLEQTQDGAWKPFAQIDPEDALTTGPAGFDKTNQVLHMLDSRGRDTAALVSVDLKSGERKIVAADPRADIDGVLGHPTEKTIVAVSCTVVREDWKILDASIEPDFAYLRTVTDGEFQIGSRTLDDKAWIVAYVLDDGPVKYYLYDRPARKARFLCTNRKALENLPLAKMHSATIKSRDGMNLVCYYTLPLGCDKDGDGRAESPAPMVLNVHGGPWGRDTWGYDPYHQWLANRGYAVMSVNFRGSTGLGKNFINAANREWAGKMHDDLVDAVRWAINRKIADPKKVAIMGGSYGGYATLVGLTFTPDLFACGVDIVGPSSLVTLLTNMPPYWKPQIELFVSRIGDHRTEEGRKFLLERSPLTHVDKIVRPLLIGQGANDPRVKQVEADQIVKAMQDKHIPVTYVLFSDEGHGFARPENRMAFNAVAEAFLAEHLGGRCEPIGGDFKGSSVAVPAGADQIRGLAEAIGKKP